jgi:hypothetical protein
MPAFGTPYSLFSWNPPKLSAPQRIQLGRAITVVGREAFVRALKIRLIDPESRQGLFTLANVLRDAEAPQTIVSSHRKLFSVALLAAGVAAIVALGGLGPLLACSAIVLPISGGLLWRTNRKIERWVQSLVDEYARSTASCGIWRIGHLSAGEPG